MPRKFYILGHPADENIGHALLLESHSWGQFDYTSLMRGARLHSLPRDIHLSVSVNSSEGNDSNVVICPFGWRIVSQDLGSSLRKVAEDHVELLDVPIFGVDGNQLQSKFVVINPLLILDALSQKKTVRSPIMLGSQYPVLKPCIISSQVPSHVHVFRVKGDEIRLFIDEVGKASLTQLPHEGLKFLPVATE